MRVSGPCSALLLSVSAGIILCACQPPSSTDQANHSKEEPRDYGPVTEARVLNVYSQAIDAIEFLDSENISWGSSIRQDLSTIKKRMEETEALLKSRRWQEAYPVYRESLVRLEELKERHGKLSDSLAAQAGAQHMRALAQQAGAQTLTPSLWKEADRAHSRARSFSNPQSEEALNHYREAGQAYRRILSMIQWTDKHKKARKEFDDAFGRLDRGFLDTHGGDAWKQVLHFKRLAEQNDQDPEKAFKAYGKALEMIPGTIKQAQTEKMKSTFETAMSEAQAHKARREWRQAAEAAERATRSGWTNTTEAVALLQEARNKIVYQTGDVRKTSLPGGVEMEFVWVQPGSFNMGSGNGYPDEQPVHPVRITKGFWIGRHEVSQTQYTALTTMNPSQPMGPHLPVTRITWEEANAYCRKLSQSLSLSVRLPTEAEWEYACRAGSDGLYCFGDDQGKLPAHGNYCDQGCAYPWKDADTQDKYARIAPIGSYQPNAWGIHDMHGNALEWCADEYDEAYYQVSPAADPGGPQGDRTHRVARGGCWQFRAEHCRSAFRYRFLPDFGCNYLGFRVVAQNQ